MGEALLSASRRLTLIGGAASLATPRFARADNPAQQSRIILTVSGRIAPPGGERVLRFDLAQIESLGVTRLTTTTPWHDHRVHFEGVSGQTLMAAIGPQGAQVTAVAVNDYAATLPIEDFTRRGLIIAYRADGQPLTLRSRGPLWIIYPYESAAELNTAVYHARSVWQLASLEIA